MECPDPGSMLSPEIGRYLKLLPIFPECMRHEKQIRDVTFAEEPMNHAGYGRTPQRPPPPGFAPTSKQLWFDDSNLSCLPNQLTPIKLSKNQRILQHYLKHFTATHYL